MCHCADGGAPVAQTLVSLEESVQRQGKAGYRAMRCCRGVKTTKHVLTIRAHHNRTTGLQQEGHICLWALVINEYSERCDVVRRRRVCE